MKINVWFKGGNTKAYQSIENIKKDLTLNDFMYMVSDIQIIYNSQVLCYIDKNILKLALYEKEIYKDTYALIN